MRPHEFDPNTDETNISFEGFLDYTIALTLIENWGIPAGLDAARRQGAVELLTNALRNNDETCVIAVPDPEAMLDALSEAGDRGIPYAHTMVRNYEEYLVLDDSPVIVRSAS